MKVVNLKRILGMGTGEEKGYLGTQQEKRMSPIDGR
jgi:hypothetical protein